MSKEVKNKVEEMGITNQVQNLPIPSPATHNPLVGILSFIERCALNNEISVEKMNQLFDIQERLMNKQAEIEYNISFAEMQAELPPIPARKKGQTAKHFTKGDANILVNPVLKKYGFALNFTTTQDNSFIKVRATLRHRSGFSEINEIILPADKGGNKTSVQEIGSSQSYGERYTMKAILNLTIIDDDTDDNGDAQVKKTNSFQNNVAADSKKAAKASAPTASKDPKEEKEPAWDKKTIYLLDNKKISFDFKSSEDAGEQLLKELVAFELKKQRSLIMNMNMPIMRALIKKSAGELITNIHKIIDEGK